MAIISKVASLAALAGICALSSKANAQAALPLSLDGGSMAQVMAGEVVTYCSADGEDVASLVPKGTPLYSTLSNVPSGKDGFAVSSVSFIPCDKSVLSLYNALTSVSTQKGITYISRREGMKPKVLFDESYFIEGVYKKGTSVTAIADPKYDALPNSEVRYAYQEDSSFGGNIYRYTFSCDGTVINVHVTNETAMKYHGITCLKERELSMFVQITPVNGGVAVNSAAIVTGHKSKVKVLVVSVDLASSFSRRTRALHDWYKEQIE